MTSTLLCLGAALALAACGGGDGDAGGEAATGTAADVTIDTAETDLGTILVDGDGMTLYMFDSDPEGESVCTDACAETWPPVEGEPGATGEADPALVGTITRPDGATQATYGGLPLYHYAPDQQPGDVTGQGVGEVWWVVAPDGTAIRDTAGATDTATATEMETETATDTTPAY